MCKSYRNSGALYWRAETEAAPEAAELRVQAAPVIRIEMSRSEYVVILMTNPPDSTAMDPVVRTVFSGSQVETLFRSSSRHLVKTSLVNRLDCLDIRQVERTLLPSPGKIKADGPASHRR